MKRKLKITEMPDFSPEAFQIVKTLKKAGFEAYFAGGWVRDFLLGKPSEDLDIATNAPPFILQKLFPRTAPVGIAFGIILVMIHDKTFEVATFRKESNYIDGRHPSHVEFASKEEDAKRRDFTINGMFFDPMENKVLDFVGGKEDLERKILRAIGNPEERIREDRLRMLRAVRLSAKFSFSIEKNTQKAIQKYAKELFPAVAIERVWQELSKMASDIHFDIALRLLHQLGLLAVIFPSFEKLSPQGLEKALSSLKNFPENAPTIAKILELFPSASLEENLALCSHFKLSRKEMDFVEFLSKAKGLLFAKKTPEDALWAHFYANPLSDLIISILLAPLKKEKKEKMTKEHIRRKQILSSFIQRIQKKKPILTSCYLQKKGISPGKQMGFLLKEGERLSINERIENPDLLWERLTIPPHEKQG